MFVRLSLEKVLEFMHIMILKTQLANSLTAVLAGARQIQGTINGLGERCGNANLISIIPTLFLKPTFSKNLKSILKEINYLY